MYMASSKVLCSCKMRNDAWRHAYQNHLHQYIESDCLYDCLHDCLFLMLFVVLRLANFGFSMLRDIAGARMHLLIAEYRQCWWEPGRLGKACWQNNECVRWREGSQHYTEDKRYKTVFCVEWYFIHVQFLMAAEHNEIQAQMTILSTLPCFVIDADFNLSVIISLYMIIIYVYLYMIITHDYYMWLHMIIVQSIELWHTSLMETIKGCRKRLWFWISLFTYVL